MRQFCIECGHLPFFHQPHCTWEGCRCRGLLVKLAKKELQVFKELAKGQTVKQIATKYQNSTKTIEAEKYTVMRKLRLHTRIDIFTFALKNGIVGIADLPDPTVSLLLVLPDAENDQKSN